MYLIEKYDPEHKLSVASPEEKAIFNQWLFFQTSGQGYVDDLSTSVLLTLCVPIPCHSPYFGQATWFTFLHPEKLPSATERYQNEVKRVLGVLESVLNKQDWLVGGKLTAVDMAFVPYNNRLSGRILPEDFDFKKEFPHTFA